MAHIIKLYGDDITMTPFQHYVPYDDEMYGINV